MTREPEKVLMLGKGQWIRALRNTVKAPRTGLQQWFHLRQLSLFKLCSWAKDGFQLTCRQFPAFKSIIVVGRGLGACIRGVMTDRDGDVRLTL